MRSSPWEEFLRPYLGRRALERFSGDWGMPSLRRRRSDFALHPAQVVLTLSAD